MEFILSYYPVLIPLAPLLAAVYSALPSRKAGDRTYGVGVVAHVVAMAVSVVTLWQVAAPGYVATRLLISETPWSFLPTIELSIDRLSAVMMVVIASIGLVLYRYSVRYMQSEQGQSRYQALLALTISTLLVMVSSRDLVLLFLVWQLLSWLLCHLAYNYAHLPTARSSFRTFIMLRLGDIVFLAGIVLAYQLWGTVEFSELFKQAAENPVTLQLFGLVDLSGATVVTLLIFVGAMSKSAQFPLHMWLPESLFAPTPIHGLLHAGIINAGGFLLTRLAPLYVLSPPTLHVVFVVGLVTAVLGTSMMLVQNDIKKTLGYSTIGQMGYMIMECGVGAFSLAIFHLIAHGMFKATIFLNCGNVIHETRHEPRRPEKPADGPSLSVANWGVGFLTSLALPLLILYAAHELLHVPLRDSQGLVIFLFFSWVTASQAMLTLYRLRGADSIKEQGIMLLVVTAATLLYLFAAELFTGFLYPTPGTVIAYYQAASLPSGLFMGILVVAVALVVIGWAGAYSKRLGRTLNRPQAITNVQTTLYLFFVNRLYLDGVALRLRLMAKKTVESLDRGRVFLATAALVAIVLAGQELTSLTTNNTLANQVVQTGVMDDMIRKTASRLRNIVSDISEKDLVMEVGFVINCRIALRLVQAFHKKVSVELHPAVSRDIERTVYYGRRYFRVCPDYFNVKVPLTPEGYLAVRKLRKENIPINFTLGFSARQNYLAARLSNPDYVNVFLGRLNQVVSDNSCGSGKYVGEKVTWATQKVLWSLRKIENSIFFCCRPVGGEMAPQLDG